MRRRHLRRGALACAAAATLAAAALAPAATHAGAPNPIARENEHRGSHGWSLASYAGATLEGYASATSVLPGGRLGLYISAAAPSFSVEVYRLGWYGGQKGRLMWRDGFVPGELQPPATVAPRTRMVEARWKRTLVVPIGKGWTTGAYVAVLRLPNGPGSYVPFVVREGTRHAPILYQEAVTTWEAYNTWGGHSLYYGLGPYLRHLHQLRSTTVSFDRPYDNGGASNFIQFELRLIPWLERNGYDVGYATDIDLASVPGLLRGRRAFLSVGHDEYWTASMRAAVTAATSAGTNLAFLGANAMYRQIRLARSAIGPNRREINYRVAARDPVARSEPALATVNWRDPPVNRPEDAVVGAMYECTPVYTSTRVYDPLPWLFRGTGLKRGDAIRNIVGGEYDRVFADRTHPRPLWVLLRGPLTCHGERSVADTTFARFPSGAGVFDAGTINFLCAFSACLGERVPVPADPRVVRVFRNLLDAYIGRARPTPEPSPRPYVARPPLPTLQLHED